VVAFGGGAVVGTDVGDAAGAQAANIAAMEVIVHAKIFLFMVVSPSLDGLFESFEVVHSL
jgi:hypothetical protein